MLPVVARPSSLAFLKVQRCVVARDVILEKPIGLVAETQALIGIPAAMYTPSLKCKPYFQSHKLSLPRSPFVSRHEVCNDPLISASHMELATCQPILGSYSCR